MDVVESQWTVKEAARFLRCSVSWVYKAAGKGEIPCVRIGAMLRFDPEELRAFAKAHALKVKEAPSANPPKAA
jgi:excisionase family DNA binding protein